MSDVARIAPPPSPYVHDTDENMDIGLPSVHFLPNVFILKCFCFTSLLPLYVGVEVPSLFFSSPRPLSSNSLSDIVVELGAFVFVFVCFC